MLCYILSQILHRVMPLKRKGRPLRNESRVKVWLRQSVYNLWKEKKEALGFGDRTNSEFAEVLEHRISILTPQSALYWPLLLSNILRRLHDDAGSVRRTVAQPVKDPKNLAPTILMKQPTDTAGLFQFRLARYGVKTKKRKLNR